MDCAICFNRTINYIECYDRCSTKVCLECGKLLIKHSYEQKQFPNCPNTTCNCFYLLSQIKKLLNTSSTTLSATPSTTLTRTTPIVPLPKSELNEVEMYETLCLNYLIKDKGEIVSKKIEKLRLIENLRRERKIFIDTNFPPAISLVVNLALGSKLKKLEKEKAELLSETLNNAKRRCMNLSCNGYLDENLLCLSCSTQFCNKCERRLTFNHVCNPDEVISIESLRSYTRCPKCSLVIERSEGCRGMTCASCGTTFDYLDGSLGDHGSNNEKVNVAEKVKLTTALRERITDSEHLRLLLIIESKEPPSPSEAPILNLLKDYVTSTSSSTNSDLLSSIRSKLAVKFENYILSKCRRRLYVQKLAIIEDKIISNTLTTECLKQFDL